MNLSNENKHIQNYVQHPVIPIINHYIAAYLIIVAVIAVIANIIVMVVISSKKKKPRTFQLCLFSMCTSDLLFSLVLHPMSIASALGYDAKRIFNYSGCLFFGIMALFFGTYDMVTHCVIGVIRYMNLCHSVTAQRMSTKYLFCLLGGCGVYSMMWSSMPAFGIGRYETFEVGCSIAFRDPTLAGRAFVNSAFIFVFFIPLVVTISSYTAIVLEAGKQRKSLESLGNAPINRSRRLEVELQLVRLTSIIAAAYMIAWFPYAIVCIWDAYVDAYLVPSNLRTLAALFCKTATATNPIIYSFLSKGFRREAMEVLHALLRCSRQRFVPQFFSSSSQKSSSCRSTSESSLRSSWLRTVKNETERTTYTTGFSSRNPTLAEAKM